MKPVEVLEKMRSTTFGVEPFKSALTSAITALNQIEEYRAAWVVCEWVLQERYRSVIHCDDGSICADYGDARVPRHYTHTLRELAALLEKEGK